jgi:hypothetical protein
VIFRKKNYFDSFRSIKEYPPFPLFSHRATREIVRELSPVSTSIFLYDILPASIRATFHRSDASSISALVSRSRKKRRLLCACFT